MNTANDLVQRYRIDLAAIEADLTALGWERSEDVIGYQHYHQTSATYCSRIHHVYVSAVSIDIGSKTGIGITTDIVLDDPIWVSTLPVLLRYVGA